MLDGVKLKPVYKSTHENVGETFYTPCLSVADEYNRVAAYFDAKSLAHYAKGLAGLYSHGGTFRLIMSEKISEEDFESISKVYEQNENLAVKRLKDIDFCNLAEKDLMHLSNLYFLLSANLVKIKMAFVKNGIFHDKFGLVKDTSGNIVYFRGSNNETEASIERNYESFEVTRSWDCGEFESAKIMSARKTFDDIWNNKEVGLQVYDISEVIKRKLVRFDMGELLRDIEIDYSGSLLLDFDMNNLVCWNFTSDLDLDTSEYFYKTMLRRYVDANDGKRIQFKPDFSYVDIGKIIKIFRRIEGKYEVELNLSKDLEDYLARKDLEIHKRYNLGIDIKNREEYFSDKYFSFKDVVDSNTARELREQQMWGAFHIVSMRKSANFSVPGTGKTSIVYGAYSYLSDSSVDKVEKIIMIGPKNSFMSWKDEFYENFREMKELKCLDIHETCSTKTDREYKLRFESGNYNLILINYESLPGLTSVLKEIIDNKCMLVFDEVHKIKAVDGVWANAALELSDKALYSVVLTGTPIPNSYQDIYNILQLLYKDEYSSFFNFDLRMLKSPSEDEVQMINDKIFPFYCRTTKTQLQIPGPDPDAILSGNMTEDEMELFKLLYEKYSYNVLVLYIRLIQASTNPGLLFETLESGDIERIIGNLDDYDMDNRTLSKKVNKNSKIARLIKSIGRTSKYKLGIEKVVELVAEDKQVVVWAMFTKTINLISKDLKDNGVNVRIIDGSVPLETREERVKQFNNSEFQVIVTNPNTMAESVSLHKACHDAIYFEYSFNLTHMLQSRDRINRLGLPQDQYTRYYYLMLESNHYRYNTIDRKIYERLKEKETVMLEAIEGNSLRRMQFNDMEDIHALLDKDMGIGNEE